MVELVKGEDLKTEVDLVCGRCGKDHSHNSGGKWTYTEGKDYVYERDTEDGTEWCICVECRENFV